jgi:hypothetical protein
MSIFATFRIGVLVCASSVTAACGSPATGPTPSNFTGLPWAGVVDVSVTCGSETMTAEADFYEEFFLEGPNQLSAPPVSSQSLGCPLDFTVSGDTATISNAPAICAIPWGGGMLAGTLTSGTMTSSDGSHLSGSQSGTTQLSGSCTFVTAIKAVRF